MDFTSIKVFWKNINIHLLQLKSLARKIKSLLYFSFTSVLWCMHLETRNNICIASSHSLQFDAITLKTKTRHFSMRNCEFSRFFAHYFGETKRRLIGYFVRQTYLAFSWRTFMLCMWQKKKTKTTFCFCSSHIVIYGHIFSWTRRLSFQSIGSIKNNECFWWQTISSPNYSSQLFSWSLIDNFSQ